MVGSVVGGTLRSTAVRRVLAGRRPGGTVAACSGATLAMPKSAIFDDRRRVASGPARSTFAGLRSRCTMPRAWIAASPCAICARTGSAHSGRRRSAAAPRAASAPSTSSITRNRVPSVETSTSTIDDDVRVAHLGGELRLAGGAREHHRVGRRGHHLEREALPVGDALHLVDAPRAALRRARARRGSARRPRRPARARPPSCGAAPRRASASASCARARGDLAPQLLVEDLDLAQRLHVLAGPARSTGARRPAEMPRLPARKPPKGSPSPSHATKSVDPEQHRDAASSA